MLGGACVQRPDKHHDTDAAPRGGCHRYASTSVASLLVALDTISILGAGYLCYLWIVDYPTSPSALYDAAILFVWLAAVMLMHFAGALSVPGRDRPCRRCRQSSLLSARRFLFLLAAAFSIKITATFSRLWLGWFAIASVTAVSLDRLMFSVIITRMIGFRRLNRNVAIVGGGAQARYLIERLEHERERPISIFGALPTTVSWRRGGNGALARPDCI